MPTPYLITNWHVVTGRNARTNELETPVQPDMLRAHFNTRMMDFGKKIYEVNIRDADNKPLWYIYPGRQRGCDLVAMLLDIGNDPVANPYPINTLKSESDLAVRIGMDVYILGYPFGIQPPGFPVWKRGSVASEPDLTKFGAGYMLVDTASRPGMSGAPVIRRSWGMHQLMDDAISAGSTPQSKFIGVYSGRLHTNDPSDAQLGMVWARFILSLMRRTPEAFKALGDRITTALMQEFPQLALPGDPGGDDQQLAREGLIERQRAMVLQSTITSEWVGTHLINMLWSVVTFTGARHLILTSDRPYVMTNGVGKPESHIVMPISPTQCFVAANTVETEKQIQRMPAKEFMQKMNDKMACQARKYVYGVDDSQLRFVSNRFGRKDLAGPGDA